MRNRRAALILGAALLALVAVRHPTVDVRVLTHDATDIAPRQLRAVVDTGLFAVDVMVTWSAEHLIP